MEKSRIFSGRKPRLVLVKFKKVRRNNPAPTSSSNDREIWKTISDFPARPLLRRVALAALSLSAVLTSASREERHAGAIPKINPLTSVMAAVKQKTPQSKRLFIILACQEVDSNLGMASRKQ